LYTADYTNLLNYPLFYAFYAPPTALSHECEEIPSEEEAWGPV